MGCGIINYSSSLSPYSDDVIPITDFALGHIIGRGEYGIVRSAIYLPKKLPIAIKQLPYHKILSNKLNFQLPFHELSILKLIYSHPNIVQLKFAFNDNSNCYFAFDYMKGGDLRYHLRNHEKFSEYGIAYLIGCLGSALHFLHNKNILHRDIKPENILLDSYGRPYLTDFGISYVDLSHEHIIPISCSSSGTRCYSAPEVFTSHHKHSYHADYWSLGMLLYELLFHERPFHDFCPPHFIEFVEIQYESLWNDLTTAGPPGDASGGEEGFLYKSKEDIDWKYYQNQPIQHAALASSELSLIELRNRQFMISSSSSSGSARVSLPRSDQSSTELGLLASQVLPLAYVIPIPRLTSLETELSDSCLDVLTRLLDIRIPFRLGTQSSVWKDELLEHEWFAEHYLTKEKINSGNANPDFSPNEVQVSSQVFMEFPENLFHSELFPMENVPVRLSTEIKEQLRTHFHYIAPDMRRPQSHSLHPHLSHHLALAPGDPTALDLNKSSTQLQRSLSAPQPLRPPPSSSRAIAPSSPHSLPASPAAAGAGARAWVAMGTGTGAGNCSPMTAPVHRPSNPHSLILQTKFHSSLESFDEADLDIDRQQGEGQQQQLQQKEQGEGWQREQRQREAEAEAIEELGGHGNNSSMTFIHKPKFKTSYTLGMSFSSAENSSSVSLNSSARGEGERSSPSSPRPSHATATSQPPHYSSSWR
jgi:serine/threonine protein kinase